MTDQDLIVTGLGAVSPAGWGVPALRAALATGAPLPATPLPRPGWERPLHVRRVPAPPSRPAFLAHPRLRRASPISHFAVAAALEALGRDGSQPPSPASAPDRLGLVFCTMTGSVVYSRRFYEEALRDPATASPLLFPETVFNAPASHLAALLGLHHRVQTEVGDATCLAGALDTAALWLQLGAVDRCLVVAAEEADWLTADGLALHQPGAIAAEGAGALLLERALDPERPALAALEPVPPPVSRPPLPPASTGTRWVDDRPDRPASPRPVLGVAWAAEAAWYCVEAAAAVAAREADRAIASVAGSYGRRMTAVFRLHHASARR